jgi:hypothetical protein
MKPQLDTLLRYFALLILVVAAEPFLTSFVRGQFQPSEPLAVSSISLPIGVAGGVYWTSLAASGGTPPYTWSLAEGEIPAGLALDAQGVIRGIPATPGTWQFAARVQDSAIGPASATARRTLQVNQPTLNVDVWSDDFETGDQSKWFAPANGLAATTFNSGGGEFNTGAGRSEVSQDFARSGRWSLKMTILAPSQMGAARIFRWHEPRLHPSLFYSVWYYFPQSYSVGYYWNIFQWKSRQSDSRSSPVDPFFTLNVANRPDGSMYLNLFDWQRRISYSQSAVDMPVRKWFNVRALYACAGDGTGRVTFWQDGTQLFDVRNVQTRYVEGDCQWSVDSISDSVTPSPAVFYVDDARISLQQFWSPNSKSWYPAPSSPVDLP